MAITKENLKPILKQHSRAHQVPPSRMAAQQEKQEIPQGDGLFIFIFLKTKIHWKKQELVIAWCLYIESWKLKLGSYSE